MRIVQVCRTAPPVLGGLEHAVWGLCRGLADRGHEVRLVTLGEPGTRRTDEVEVVRLRPLGPRRWPTARGIARACAGAELVHVHAVDGMLDALVLHGVRPLGLSTHGAYFHTPAFRRLKALWLRTGTRAALRGVDRVWFSSEADRERFAPLGVEGTVEPAGVDVDRFTSLRRAPERGRWLVLGRVDVHKGLADLFPALALLRDLPFRVEVVGPEHAPGLVGALVAEARRLGVADRVTFRGPLVGAALDEAVRRAELALFPSRYEGFGIAAVELMAAGVPVVLSDIPAFRAHAAVAPLADFRAPAAAARAIRGALANPDPGPAARRAASFGWPARVRAWEERYRELLLVRR